MTRRTLTLLFALLAVTPLAAAAQNPVVGSLRGLFDITRANIQATAEILNEEQYAFRPTPEVRTAGQILAHVADGQYIFCSAAAGEASPMTQSVEQTRTTKAAIMEALEAAFEYCESVMGRTTDAQLGTARALFEQPNTVGGILAFNSAHNYEHYGNLVTYMRINGIVPPSSR
jgi:uncharacterized damage-inducible protein DinB